MILADDLGAGRPRRLRRPDIRTPNLDRLAASGVRFTQGYSAGAVCSPTRVALYTGRHPAGSPAGCQSPSPTTPHGIPPEHPTLASLLRGAGYSTAHGRQVARRVPAVVLAAEVRLGRVLRQLLRRPRLLLQDADGYDLYDGEEQVEDPRYYTDIVTERAVEFVRRDARPAVAAQPQLHHAALALGGPGDKAVSEELTARIKAGDTRALFH